MSKNIASEVQPAESHAANQESAPGRLKVGLIGFGTVGRSVAKILATNPNGPLSLQYICNRDIARKKITGLPPSIRWTESADEVLSSGVDVVVELVGGLEPAGEWIRRALNSKKSVVTANKLLISERGAELTELARRMGRRLEYGASVAGGVPAIIGIQEGLAGDQLYRIAGILNGTCNYILTQMEAHGASFDSALKEAQKLGYAEADPTSDIEGYDARAKLVILTQAGLHLRVKNEQIPCRPISLIESVDFAYVRELNCTIRQISCAQKDTSKGLRLFSGGSAGAGSALVPHRSCRGQQEHGDSSGEFAGHGFSGYGGRRPDSGGSRVPICTRSRLFQKKPCVPANSPTLHCSCCPRHGGEGREAAAGLAQAAGRVLLRAESGGWCLIRRNRPIRSAEWACRGSARSSPAAW